MSKLNNFIYKEILKNSNILIVGSTDSGKTWYVKNILIPFLQDKKKKVVYFHNPDNLLGLIKNVDFFIVDEIETLIDKDFLEAHSTEIKPYYSKKYLKKVKGWHNKLKKITIPSIFILTRNNQKEIDNVVNNIKVIDWGVKVKCLAFKKQKQE
ncbi:MAG TPA: hypothetical protein ENH26_00290 [Candidatus Wolfebacteria bacterium]|nr:hypothetical protein [Candidatus Wolfebacteria bacterium]